MKWIGLTGGIGTGKTSVATLLRAMKVQVVDADELARLAMEPGGFAYGSVLHEFGHEILGPDQVHFDRAKIAQIVFAKPNRLRVLESIVHPIVKKMVADFKLQQENLKANLAVYDVPLLFEKSMQQNFDGVLVVHCEEKLQIQRTMKRSGLSEIQVKERMKNQIPISEKIKMADWKIDNSKGLSELEQEVKKWIASLGL